RDLLPRMPRPMSEHSRRPRNRIPPRRQRRQPHAQLPRPPLDAAELGPRSRARVDDDGRGHDATTADHTATDRLAPSLRAAPACLTTALRAAARGLASIAGAGPEGVAPAERAAVGRVAAERAVASAARRWVVLSALPRWWRGG